MKVELFRNGNQRVAVKEVSVGVGTYKHVKMRHFIQSTGDYSYRFSGTNPGVRYAYKICIQGRARPL